MTASAVLYSDGYAVVVETSRGEIRHFAFARMHGSHANAWDAAEEWARLRAPVLEWASPRVVPNHPPSEMELQRFWKGPTKALTEADLLELARALYPEVQLDRTLPTDWVRTCLAKGFDPRGRFVWAWPPGLTTGRPLALSREAAQELERLS